MALKTMAVIQKESGRQVTINVKDFDASKYEPITGIDGVAEEKAPFNPQEFIATSAIEAPEPKAEELAEDKSARRGRSKSR